MYTAQFYPNVGGNKQLTLVEYSGKGTENHLVMHETNTPALQSGCFRGGCSTRVNPHLVPHARSPQ